MLLDYIKAIWDASWEFSKTGTDIVEVLVALIFLFVPGFFKKFETSDIQYEKSVRKILLYKFITNDKWRVAVVLILCLFVHISVIAPYKVYSGQNREITELTNQLQTAQSPSEPEMTITVLVTNSCKYPIEISDKFTGELTESYGGGSSVYGEDPYRLLPVQKNSGQSAFTIPAGESREYNFLVPDNFKTVYERGAADFNFGLSDGHNSMAATVAFNHDAIHGQPVIVSFKF
jgi:hypothetical protein